VGQKRSSLGLNSCGSARRNIRTKKIAQLSNSKFVTLHPLTSADIPITR
jgi:hypothetical protein